MNQYLNMGNIQVETYDCFADIADNYDRHRANLDESVYLQVTTNEPNVIKDSSRSPDKSHQEKMPFAFLRIIM